jgi:hypothetical protein
MKRLISSGQQRSSGLMLRVPQFMQDALLDGSRALMTYDSATAGGMAFLEAELEKRDPKVREPLTSVTWMRDIVCKTGGGWVDFTSAFFVDYATSGPNQYGLVGGQTTAIPVMQADLNKDIWKVFNWMNVNKVTFVDMKKSQQIGRSLDEMLDKGVRLNWNKSLDLIVYQGWGGYPGLTNSTVITRTDAAAGASTLTTWVSKTPEEILYDINVALVATWAASEYDLSGMADYILVPPSQYGLLCTRMISLAGNRSILDYLYDNNIGKNQGRDLKIMPSRWCIGAGSGTPATDRMIAYANDEDRVYFDVTVPINRAMTMPDVNQGAYLTLYAGQVGPPKFLYLQPFVYVDGI